jgi:polygalacturonase
LEFLEIAFRVQPGAIMKSSSHRRAIYQSNFIIPVVLALALGPLVVVNERAAQPPAANRIFDARQSGAKGDGRTLDTAAIQTALDKCGTAGGGIVRFPAGTYLSKPVFLHSRTTLQLEAGAVLQATDERADFLKPGKTNSFIAFVNGTNLHDIAIVGPGSIDGAGAPWWGPAEAARRRTPGFVLPRPRMIALTGCDNVRVLNVTLKNSPLTHLALMACVHVAISNVTVRTPSGAANTDAIDPINCKDVLITRCCIDTGDDNISIKSEGVLSSRPFASEDITVTDCLFLHGHGMSIGAATIGGVRNVVVRNCRFENTENGIRIKSVRGRGGTVENVLFSDITMSNVNPAITFTCYYMTNSAGDPVPRFPPEHDLPQPVNETTPVFRNICVSNLTATCQKSAGIIVGLPESPISNVVLENVNIRSATTGLSIRNARDLRFKNVTVVNGQGPPFIVQNAQVEGMKTGTE